MIAATGYKGFGSFHSDNVEELVRVPRGEYVPPPPTADADVVAAFVEGAAPPPFGHAFRARYFYLDPDWTFVNHGAFGASCVPALQAADRWRVHCEKQPLRFIDRELFPLLVHSIRALGDVVNAPPTRLALIPNATYGMNVAVAAAGIRRGDVVFALDIAYGSVKKMLTLACAAAGATLVVHTLRMPLSGPEDIVAQVRAALPASGCRLAVFDHVASNTGIVLPIVELAALAKAAGARVLIDGAHGLQSQPLDLATLDVDWYTSNCHKWLCSGKGVAFLYAAEDVLPATRSLVVSHGYGDGFASDFIWEGTRDTSHAVALPTLLRWWDRVGHEAARTYCRALLRDAVSLLTTAWGTGTHAPLSCYSHLACVELPARCLPPGVVAPAGDGSDGVVPAATSVHGKLVQDTLHYRAAVECPVKTMERRLYVRISAAVYNELADYRRLADAVLAMKWEGDAAQAAVA